MWLYFSLSLSTQSNYIQLTDVFVHKTKAYLRDHLLALTFQGIYLSAETYIRSHFKVERLFYGVFYILDITFYK